MIEATMHWAGLTALLLFVLAYAAVMVEERLHLRKSIAVLVAAGLIWILVGLVYAQAGQTDAAAELVRHDLLDFAELFLFLFVAMTFVNTLEERGVFHVLRVWLVGRGFSLRSLFWVTGGLAFLLSPVADNLTTALIVGAVVMAVGRDHARFVSVACINVVVAANAGGAFSPFGDITTLMVWQQGIIPFTGFFPLILPALVNWLVPASVMSLTIEASQPAPIKDWVSAEAGALSVVVLFLSTIMLTVLLHNFLHLPPAVGMMFGLGLLKLYSYGFNQQMHRRPLVIDELNDTFARSPLMLDPADPLAASTSSRTEPRGKPIYTFQLMERIEWDTLLFFYGVILAVGGLGALGYLAVTSRFLYLGLGPTVANVLIGLLSAIVDNVPVMFAVLSMNPTMSEGQWLLVTLTAGVGGSLLSIGSAAGVALMGQARGAYTFMTHLRWSWAIALGYAASIGTHLLLNRHLF